MAQTHRAVIVRVRIASSLSFPSGPDGSLSMGGPENLEAQRSEGAKKTLSALSDPPLQRR